MRLRDKLKRMENGEILDADDLSQQTEAHGNRFAQRKSVTKKQTPKNQNSGG